MTTVKIIKDEQSKDITREDLIERIFDAMVGGRESYTVTVNGQTWTFVSQGAYSQKYCGVFTDGSRFRNFGITELNQDTIAEYFEKDSIITDIYVSDVEINIRKTGQAYEIVEKEITSAFLVTFMNHHLEMETNIEIFLSNIEDFTEREINELVYEELEEQGFFPLEEGKLDISRLNL